MEKTAYTKIFNKDHLLRLDLQQLEQKFGGLLVSINTAHRPNLDRRRLSKAMFLPIG
jgi:hypothetical protein